MCDYIAQQKVKIWHMTGLIDVLATCVPKSTWIVVSCDPEFYWGRAVWCGKMWSFVHWWLACSADSASAEPVFVLVTIILMWLSVSECIRVYFNAESYW